MEIVPARFGEGRSETCLKGIRAGRLLYKNLGEALQGVLARHLAAHRKRQTETARASPLQTSQVGERH